MSILERIVALAPCPVFVIAGDGGRQAIRRLFLDPRLDVAWSPRHASVLLVVGRLRSGLVEAARHVHDQIAAPRGTVVWGGKEKAPFADPVRIDADEDPVPALLDLHRALLVGARESAVVLGATDNPVEWRGVGPHGQGGKGMMGGVPYGRPMAMTDDDVRDGLALDALSVPLGPFLPWMPPGLRLDVTLQGDVVQDVERTRTDYVTPDLREVFVRAQSEAVAVAALELARARHHLEVTAELLRLHHLDGFALRALKLARRARPEAADDVRRLSQTLSRTRALGIGTRGVGYLDEARAARLGGPIARASGAAVDERLADPAYAELGFEPVTHARGDAEARWQQRLAEAAQSLDLAGRAGERRHDPSAPLEGPRGPVPSDSRASMILRDLGVRQAFDAFVTTLVSLDLDPVAEPPEPSEPSDA